MKLLNERISDTVYHITFPQYALEILKTNQFKGSPVYDSDTEVNINPEGFNYYLSASRQRENTYSSEVLLEQGRSVMFKLDGSKLNTRYRGKAVDFQYYAGVTNAFADIKRETETEDRIFLKDPIIKNFTQYIQEAYIYVEVDPDFEGIQLNVLGPLLLQLKKRNIPYYLYTDTQDFFSNKKNNALSSEEILNLFRDEEGRLSYDPQGMGVDRDKESAPRNRISSSDKESILTLINLYFSKSVEEFIKRNKSLGSPIIKDVQSLKKFIPSKMTSMIDRIQDLELMTYLRNEFIPEDQRYINVLEKILKKEKVRDINNTRLTNKLQNKWKSLLSKY